MSPVTQAMIINGSVLFAVLEADLGPHRKVGALRILRPVLLTAAIVPLYLTALATHGTGLAIEIVGAAAGLVLGLLATSLMTVYRSTSTGRPVTRAGRSYATVWIVVIGARAAFSYGSEHWFRIPLGTWMLHHSVTPDDITNGLILMAVAMTLSRTLGLLTQSAALPSAEERPVYVTQ